MNVEGKAQTRTITEADSKAIAEAFDYDVSVMNQIYVAGDGAGLTRGLAQAGANGILVARDIIKRLGE